MKLFVAVHVFHNHLFGNDLRVQILDKGSVNQFNAVQQLHKSLPNRFLSHSNTFFIPQLLQYSYVNPNVNAKQPAPFWFYVLISVFILLLLLFCIFFFFFFCLFFPLLFIFICFYTLQTTVIHFG